jgi:hypothetical protein
MAWSFCFSSKHACCIGIPVAYLFSCCCYPAPAPRHSSDPPTVPALVVALTLPLRSDSARMMLFIVLLMWTMPNCCCPG